MHPKHRRDFLQESMIALGLASTAAAARAAEPASKRDNPAPTADALRVAVVGVRGRGMDHIQGFQRQAGAKIVAICDTDEKVIGPAMKAIEERNGTAPTYHQDIRKLLESKEIDAVSLAMPNHWHALGTVWACAAGKDVYVEKPATYTVAEGRRMIEAAQKYQRVVQVGTQCRSHKGIQDAMAFLHSGGLGEVYMAKGLCYKPRGSIGHKPDGPVPEGLD